jgi:hypothetical protein
VAEIQPFDREIFTKEREDFTAKALANKKNSFVEDWLRQLEDSAELKIGLNDYDKYYR